MKQRVSILAEVSSAIAFLHAETPPVVHHDITRKLIFLCLGMLCNY